MPVQPGTASAARFSGPQLARWRPLLELVALLVFVASLLTVVGICISASGSSDVNFWARVDEVASRVAAWEYLLVLALGLGFVLALRVLFEWPADMPAGRARAVLVLGLVNAGAIAAAAVMGTIALFFAKYEFGGFGDEHIYDGVKRGGEFVAYVGIVLAVTALTVLAARGFTVTRAQATPEPIGPAALGSPPRARRRRT